MCVPSGLEENSYKEMVSGSCCTTAKFNVKGLGAHQNVVEATDNAMHFG